MLPILKSWLNKSILAIATTAFVADVALSHPFPVGVLYAPIVLLGLRRRDRRLIDALALVATAMTVAGFLLPTISDQVWLSIINRAAALFSIAVTWLMVRQNNNTLQALAIQTERAVADRKKAEAASAAKSSFLANMSHELRTPLNAMLGFSDLLRRGTLGPLTSKQQEYVEDINASGHRLLSTIEDILNFSRVASGQFELYDESVDPERLLGDIEAAIAAQAGEQGIKITVRKSTPECVLRVDPAALRQALLQIASNAVKFTPPGGQVVLTCTRDESGFEFSISDTGVGVPPEMTVQIFEPFVQAESAYMRSHQGAGLGLSISKAIIERHGGYIRLENQRPKGTIVRAYIPNSRVDVSSPRERIKAALVSAR